MDVKQSLYGYVALMLVPVVATAFLMALVPTPQAVPTHAPCVGYGILRACGDDDALAVELFEYATVAYVGFLTAGFIAWAANPRTRIGLYALFVSLFLLYGAVVMLYQPIVTDFLSFIPGIGNGDHDETWFSAFFETYVPMLVYTFAWVINAAILGIVRRENRA